MPKEQRETGGLTTPDLIILSFLMERPMHGYQMALELKERQVEDWAGVSRPQVYYSLKKLEASGLIRGESDGDSSSGPERRVFTLTKEARSALAGALESDKWATSRPVPLFSTWAMLSVYARKPTVKRVIEQRRDFLREEIVKERETLDGIVGDGTKSTRIAATMVSLSIKTFDLELAWLDEFESVMGTGR
jgi:DNA-binding PadR family transcriptional regulator